MLAKASKFSRDRNGKKGDTSRVSKLTPGQVGSPSQRTGYPEKQLRGRSNFSPLANRRRSGSRSCSVAEIGEELSGMSRVPRGCSGKEETRASVSDDNSGVARSDGSSALSVLFPTLGERYLVFLSRKSNFPHLLSRRTGHGDRTSAGLTAPKLHQVHYPPFSFWTQQSSVSLPSPRSPSLFSGSSGSRAQDDDPNLEQSFRKQLALVRRGDRRVWRELISGGCSR